MENGPFGREQGLSAETSARENFARLQVTVLQFSWFVITFLVLSLFVVDLAGRYRRLVESVDPLALQSLGMTLQGFALYMILLETVVILAHVLISGIIFFRRPFDWMALLVAIALVVNGAIIPLRQTVDPTGLNEPVWGLLRSMVVYTGLVSSIVLLTLFPDGRFVPAWTRPFALIWAVIMFFALFLPGSPLSLTTWHPALRLVVLLSGSIAGAHAQYHRFSRSSTPVERQQTKWALLGLIAAAASPLAFFVFTSLPPDLAETSVPNLLFQRVGSSFFSMVVVVRLVSATLRGIYFLLFPLSFAVAILRYRLWDIDILIRRTLIYSVLTGLLVVIYFASVLVLQAGFVAFTGQGRSELVSVVSTLAIAALFVPMRRRVQDAIDRRFYQQKYDVTQTLLSFNQSLRDEVDLDQLCYRLIRVVEDTMQPDCVSLWVRETVVVPQLEGEEERLPLREES